METGLRKQLNDVKQKVDGLVKEVERHLTDINEQMSVLNEVVAAAVGIIGKEEVQAEVLKARQEKREQQEKQQDDSLQLLLAKSILVPAEVSTDDTTVVTREVYPDGSVRREQFRPQQLQDAKIKAWLTGAKVGDKFDINSAKVEVVGIYRFDNERAQAVMAEEQAAVAAAKAAEAQPQPQAGA